METRKPLFRDLNPNDPDPETTEIESLCMNCYEKGITRILLTKIPFYKEVVVMSFNCDKCGYQNNEIQPGGPIQDKGIRIILNVKTEKDLNRQVVKSDCTSVKIVELDFEIPGNTQKGEVTTVEGIINRAIAGLEQDQAARKVDHPEVANKIDQFIKRLQALKELKTPFTIILEDTSGNSFIENSNIPKIDENCSVHRFTRSKEQDHELGIFTQNEVIGEDEPSILHPVPEGDFTLKDLEGEVLQFPTNCPGCRSPCQTNMKMTNIPHFKEVVIMATTCDVCGLKTNEVKSGGGIEPRGVKMEIDIKSRDDFSRDVLKSETCNLTIPELQLEVGPHALGGRFTTIEGLITAIRDQLNDPNYSHIFGDSTEVKTKEQFDEFMKNFDRILDGTQFPITLILDDPAGNSYIQSMNDDNQLDANLRITHYERSFEQNDELGLNDMKTENYETNSNVH